MKELGLYYEGWFRMQKTEGVSKLNYAVFPDLQEGITGGKALDTGHLYSRERPTTYSAHIPLLRHHLRASGPATKRNQPS